MMNGSSTPLGQSSSSTERLLRGGIKLIYFLILLLMIPFIASFYKTQMATHQKIISEIEGLKKQKAYKSQQLQSIKRDIELVKTDSSYLEIKARDYENLQKPGEHIIRFSQPPSSSITSPKEQK
jgi:cell division protein FtsB